MAEFINPFTDEGFKRLFGQELPAYLKEIVEELEYFEDVMNVASMTDEELDRYERLLDAYRQEMNVMSFYIRKGKEEGLEKGKAIGRAIGRAEDHAAGVTQGEILKNRENAKSMLQLGVDVAIIEQVTGLTSEEIQQL